MNIQQLAYLTAALYWCLVLCWLAILGFYWREYRRLIRLTPMVGMMLVVVFVDGARTLLESIYFGTWYTARTGLIPRELWTTLSEPQYVLAPKVVNLLAALTIIGVLVRRWFPDLAAEMERQRRTEQLYTDLQHAHRELQQVQQARDSLAAMIVHDLRTPLTSIITGLRTAQMVEAEGAAPEFIDGAIRGADRLLGMVNDLLDVSKMEAGEMTLAWELVSLPEVIEEAVSIVQPLAHEKQLVVGLDLAESGGAEAAECDREKIRRVLVNLLGNAIKFTPDEGTITIRLRRLGRAGIRVAVCDTGPGIAAEHLPRLFDKFYQVEPHSGRQAASGLGLAFCKLAVEAHGGEFGVDSSVGEGSCFWFTVPERDTDASDT